MYGLRKRVLRNMFQSGTVGHHPVSKLSLGESLHPITETGDLMRGSLDWMEAAKCVDNPTTPPDTWFGTTPALIAQAKAVCASCPVQSLCLMEGADSSDGIFGGLTAIERKAPTAQEQYLAVKTGTVMDLYREGKNVYQICQILGANKCGVNTIIKNETKKIKSLEVCH